MKILVTGGVRSGKSRHAEGLLANAPMVHYVAPGPIPDPASDPEWAARVAAHQAGRPENWQTHETIDIPAVLAETTGPVLVDCLGTWLTSTLDQMAVWERPESDWAPQLRARIDDLAAAWAATEASVVAVTNEVGWGLVSEHRSGRIFADWLGRTNQAVAAASDEVHLVIAGRHLTL